MNKDLCRIAICALLCLTSASSAFSQAVNGSLTGTVTDTSGGLITGAKVTLTETNTKISKVGQTNMSGAYDFPELPPGTYSVTVEMAGFKKEVKAGIILEANTSPRVDLRLQPGDVSQTIEVTASSRGAADRARRYRPVHRRADGGGASRSA